MNKEGFDKLSRTLFTFDASQVARTGWVSEFYNLKQDAK